MEAVILIGSPLMKNMPIQERSVILKDYVLGKM
jgi:hypothetical protein